MLRDTGTAVPRDPNGAAVSDYRFIAQCSSTGLRALDFDWSSRTSTGLDISSEAPSSTKSWRLRALRGIALELSYCTLGRPSQIKKFT